MELLLYIILLLSYSEIHPEVVEIDSKTIQNQQGQVRYNNDLSQLFITK